MNAVQERASELQERLSTMAKRLKDQQWGRFGSNDFQSATETLITELKTVRSELSGLNKLLEFETTQSEPELKKKTAELQPLLQTLEKNRQLEQTKTPNRLAEWDWTSTQQKHNEQFAHIQFLASNWLLQTHYLLERVSLETQKRGFSVAKSKNTSQALLELLKERENELEKLRFNYANARMTTLTGMHAENAPAELEKDLQINAQKIAIQQHKLSEHLQHYKKISEELHATQQMVAHEINALQQLLWKHFDQNTELVSTLKKERDFARQLALDTEHEGLNLRSKYSSELLGLQDKIVSAQLQTQKQSDQKISSLQNELVHKTQTIEQLLSTTRKLETQINALEQKNHELRLALATYQKHDSAKKALNFKTKQNE